jgi:hypothetical protein
LAPNSNIFIREQDSDFAYELGMLTLDRSALLRLAETAYSMHIRACVISLDEMQFTAECVARVGAYDQSYIYRGPGPWSEDLELKIYLDSFHFGKGQQLGPPAIENLLELGFQLVFLGRPSLRG